MRGTGYAIAEIIWWMLAAAAVGFSIGWVMRRWSQGNELAEEWEGRFEAEQQRGAAASDEAAALRDKVAELQGEVDSARAHVGRLQADLDTKAAELEALSAAAVDRTDVDEDQAAPSEHRAAGEPDADSGSETPNSDRETALARVAEIAVRTRRGAPAVDDDLQQIRGVGPELEELLKALDITSYRQVANFTAEDVGFVTAALEAVPGRIEREDWMASAAEQHVRKYGTSAG